MYVIYVVPTKFKNAILLLGHFARSTENSPVPTDIDYRKAYGFQNENIECRG